MDEPWGSAEIEHWIRQCGTSLRRASPRQDIEGSRRRGSDALPDRM